MVRRAYVEREPRDGCYPEPSLQIESIGNAGLTAMVEAFAFYLFVKRTCERLGAPISSDAKVLDFGVGWGRVLRCFLRDTDQLWGVDVSQRFLGAAYRTGLPARLFHVAPFGELPRAAPLFDVVIAYSVFTHLPPQVQDQWLARLAATMVRGGVFVATVQPPNFAERIQSNTLVTENV